MDRRTRYTDDEVDADHDPTNGRWLEKEFAAALKQWGYRTARNQHISGSKPTWSRGEAPYRMNRRLHKLPFHKFEKFVSYKATWREISTDTVDAYYNSKTCSCCGERGYRQGRRFRCTDGECDVV